MNEVRELDGLKKGDGGREGWRRQGRDVEQE